MAQRKAMVASKKRLLAPDGDFYIIAKTLAEGENAIRLNVSGIGRGGTGVLKVDGKAVARQTMDHTIPLIMRWDENFDIGADTGTPVSNGYQVPFRFTGKLNKLTLKTDRPKLSPEDEKRLSEARRNNRMSE
jgi:hypothetical protein